MDGRAGSTGKRTHSDGDMLSWWFLMGFLNLRRGSQKLFYVLKTLDLKLSHESIFVVLVKEENTKDRIYGSAGRPAFNFVKMYDSL